MAEPNARGEGRKGEPPNAQARGPRSAPPRDGSWGPSQRISLPAEVWAHVFDVVAEECEAAEEMRPEIREKLTYACERYARSLEGEHNG